MSGHGVPSNGHGKQRAEYMAAHGDNVDKEHNLCKATLHTARQRLSIASHTWQVKQARQQTRGWMMAGLGCLTFSVVCACAYAESMRMHTEAKATAVAADMMRVSDHPLPLSSSCSKNTMEEPDAAKR